MFDNAAFFDKFFRRTDTLMTRKRDWKKDVHSVRVMMVGINATQNEKPLMASEPCHYLLLSL